MPSLCAPRARKVGLFVSLSLSLSFKGVLGVRLRTLGVNKLIIIIINLIFQDLVHLAFVGGTVGCPHRFAPPTPYSSYPLTPLTKAPNSLLAWPLQDIVNIFYCTIIKLGCSVAYSIYIYIYIASGGAVCTYVCV